MMKRFGKAAVLVVLVAGTAAGLAALESVSAGARSMLPGGATLSLNDQSTTEGNTATFTVSITRRQLAPVRVSWFTQDGTATAPGDYATQSGNVVIPSWKYSVSFPVTSKNDAVAEGSEYFYVRITSPDIVVFDGTGVFTLYDAPVVHISDAPTVTEGANFTYTFTLSHSSPQTVTSTYVVWNNFYPGAPPWVTGTDYSNNPSTTVTFTAGQTVQTVTYNTVIDAEGARDLCGGSQYVWLHMKTATNANLPYATTPELGSPPGVWSDYTTTADPNDNWGVGYVNGKC